eukprot:1182973-Prorocentrum_minimum.AAC.7
MGGQEGVRRGSGGGQEGSCALYTGATGGRGSVRGRAAAGGGGRVPAVRPAALDPPPHGRRLGGCGGVPGATPGGGGPQHAHQDVHHPTAGREGV